MTATADAPAGVPGAAPLTPRPGVAERLARMVRVPTVAAGDPTSGDPTEDAFDQRAAFPALLAELYPLVHERLDVETLVSGDGVRSLLYRWAGRDQAADPLVLMAHLDVVPAAAGDGWTYPPFDGVVADGWVYGRGSLDDKGPLAVVLEAVENLLAAGFTPARDVYLSFGADEEGGGTGAQAAVARLQERGVTPWLVLDEGGAVVTAPLPGVAGQVALVGVAEKGFAAVELAARSDGGHASAPPPLTAVSRLSRAVDRLGPRTFPARIPSAVAQMLALLAPTARGPWRALYRVLVAAPRLGAQLFAALGGEPAAMVRTTVAATMQTGGTAVNVLPPSASVTLNLRLAPGDSLDRVLARLRARVADPLVDVRLVQGNDPSPTSPTDDERFALLTEAVRTSHPDAVTVPYLMMAASDARYFHRAFPAVYRFAPLAMSAAQRAGIHGLDERVEVAELERGEVFHRTLLLRLASPASPA
ncbi:M20/M25/M40 family metallo-hydrolase [Pseudokineococcus sp. 1T1Z-3]|uniref:M20/M25/M40 family metallo-hydrolase n=1 Tax=Pseudokineococcus sp. 1T1Z-3 TaxID=3132745 RepID=UPI0030991715